MLKPRTSLAMASSTPALAPGIEATMTLVWVPGHGVVARGVEVHRPPSPHVDRIVCSPSEMDAILRLHQEPPAPTEALRELFRDPTSPFWRFPDGNIAWHLRPA